MSGSKHVGFQSSLIVNRGLIAACFVLSLLAWRLGLDAVAALLLALSIIGLISYLWGMFALKDLEIRVTAETTVLSVGQSAETTYQIENNKALPLVWLEICQDVPKNGCLEPDSSMTLRSFSETEAELAGRENAYMRRFAFLMGHSDLTWKCRWTGRRRGVYRPQDLLVRSGDGFGLTQSVCEYSGMKNDLFVVWPKIIPVQTAPLLRNLWTGRTGRSGWTEDITILRDERLYQEGDSWKRIDWRTAARTDELYTKQFERIRPQSLLLAVETYAFENAEEALSLAASLLCELFSQGISAGLVLPATGQKESILIRPDGSELQKCLFEIADHDESTAFPDGFRVRSIAAAAEESGHLWIMGKDRNSIAAGKLGSALRYLAPGFITEEACAGSVSFAEIRSGGDGV